MYESISLNDNSEHLFKHNMTQGQQAKTTAQAFCWKSKSPLDEV